MLLLAWLERAHDEIPASLRADLNLIMTKIPILLTEMAKIAIFPRPPLGYGWMAPALACVEMLQCVVQAVTIGARKLTPTGGKGGGGGGDLASLLQLPHFDEGVLRKLKRHLRAGSVRELQELADRAAVLEEAGLSTAQVRTQERVVTVALTAMVIPSLMIHSHTA